MQAPGTSPASGDHAGPPGAAWVVLVCLVICEIGPEPPDTVGTMMSPAAAPRGRGGRWRPIEAGK